MCQQSEAKIVTHSKTNATQNFPVVALKSFFHKMSEIFKIIFFKKTTEITMKICYPLVAMKYSGQTSSLNNRKDANN